MFSKVIRMQKHAALIKVFFAPLLCAGFCVITDYFYSSAYINVSSR